MELAWVLSDGKMQLVEESEDGKICKEKTTSTKIKRTPEDYVAFRCQDMLSLGCSFVSSKFYEQIPQPISHSIHPFNHSALHRLTIPPSHLPIVSIVCAGLRTQSISRKLWNKTNKQSNTFCMFVCTSTSALRCVSVESFRESLH